MNWYGFAAFCAASVTAFAIGAWGCRRGRRREALYSGALLLLLVGSAWLRYHPTLEAALFRPEHYAYVRPWWSFVFGLAFLGSAIPQLAGIRKRLGLCVLAAILFSSVAHRAAAAARVDPVLFTGSPGEWKTCQQTTAFSCGAASASTLLSQVGIHTTEREMAKRCLTTLFSGTDEIGLLKGLTEKLAGTGLEAQILLEGVEEITPEQLPAMAYTTLSLMIGHWVVILDCDETTVTVSDPMTADDPVTGGIAQISRSEFGRGYRGVLVRIRPTDEAGEESAGESRVTQRE